MDTYVLCLDIGTTNIKAFLFEKNGEIFAQAKRKPKYIMEEKGQVEQDPKEIWELSKQVMEEVIKSNNLSPENIAAIGITTQRASFLFWDKNTGKIYSNIITWQDKRCALYTEKKNKSFYFRFLRGITKFIYLFTRDIKLLTFSTIKFTTDHTSMRTGYFLETHPEVKELISNPNTSVVWGTIDAWILWNLTEGRVFATDYSNAHTGLVDPFKLEYNSIYLKAMGIPEYILPEIRDTRGDFGKTKIFGGEIPITCLIGDQMASLFGQCCFNKGSMKVTNGTGSFVDLNTGQKCYASKRKLYPLIAWHINEQTTYMTEGMSHNAGNIIDWLQNELGLYNDPSETEKMALSVDSTEGVYFLPTFTTGISFPYWDSTARGNIFGVDLETKKEHIVRAVLEGFCFRIKDIVEGIIKDTKIQIEKIKADGGVSQNKFLLQFLSDILEMDVELTGNPETTALGAAFMAGLAVGYWKSEEELLQIRRVEKTYKPQMTEEERNRKYKIWKDIVARSLHFVYF